MPVSHLERFKVQGKKAMKLESFLTDATLLTEKIREQPASINRNVVVLLGKQAIGCDGAPNGHR